MHATQTLSDEHQTILRVLACVETLVEDEAHANEPVATFTSIVDFLRTYADKLHHGKEEALLFPAMESNGMPAEQGPTAVMRLEHEEGRALVRQMSEVCEGDGFSVAAFGVPGMQFVTLLRGHIGKEDNILFPMAERMLKESQLSQLANAYAATEARDFEPDVHEHYESWARELAGRLGVDQERFVVQPGCHT